MNASNVVDGIVLMVSRPTSGSTYFKSGYAGSFFPVLAQSGRCSRPPRSVMGPKRVCRCDVIDRLTRNESSFKSADVCLRSLRVCINREDQRYVDVDAVRSRGDFDHGVRTPNPRPHVVRHSAKDSDPARIGGSSCIDLGADHRSRWQRLAFRSLCTGSIVRWRSTRCGQRT